MEQLVYLKFGISDQNGNKLCRIIEHFEFSDYTFGLSRIITISRFNIVVFPKTSK